MSETRRLARELVKIQKDLFDLQSTPQLGNSSIDDGALGVNDRDGQQTMQIGKQYDGTYTAAPVAGPPPPVPSTPLLTPFIGGIKIRWDGFFADPETVAPMDFSRVEVHASTSPFVPDTTATLLGTLESPRGGDFTAQLPPVLHYVRLVARSQSGRPSEASLSAWDTPLELDVAALQGSTIFYNLAGDDPLDAVFGDLWLWYDEAGHATVQRYTPAGWIDAADQSIAIALLAALEAADRAALAANDAAAAANIAAGKTKTYRQPSAPASTGRVNGDSWYDTDDDNRLYVWFTTEWRTVQFGNNAIKPASLVASDVIATGTVSAGLLEAIMVLATTIVAGDPEGSHARMSPEGFQVFRQDVNGDGLPEVAVRLGTANSDRFATLDDEGKLLTSIDQAGRMTVQGLTVNSEPYIMGRPFGEYLSNSGGRLVGEAWVPIPQMNGITTERGLIDVAVKLELGRAYRVVCGGIHIRNNAETAMRLRVVAGGTAPTVSSTVWRGTTTYVPGIPSSNQSPRMEIDWTNPKVGGSTGLHRMLWTIASASTFDVGASVGDGGGAWIKVYDMGPEIPNTGTLNNGGGIIAGGATEVAKQTYVQEFGAAWLGSYRGNGALRTDTPELIQGYVDSSNGNQRAMLGFPDVTAMLAGATVNRVQVYLIANHWYSYQGGTAVLGVHGNTGKPGTYSGPVQENVWQSGGWPRGGGRWVDIATTAAHADSWRTGAYRGIVLGPGPSNAGEFYGRFAGGAVPRLAITYTK